MRFVSNAVPVLAALLVFVSCDKSNGQPSESTPASGARGGGGGRGGRGNPADRVVPVEIAIAERGTIRRTTSVSGVVEPIRRVGVNAQLSGAVLSIGVEEGDVVRVGQVIAQMDARELDAQLTSAKAALTAAQSAMDRATKLRKAEIYSDMELERDRTALAAAKAQHDQLVTRLGYATVRAPISGVVMEKRVEAGDVVGTQGRLFTIADISTLVVRFNISELEVAGMRVGQAVAITIDALADRPVDGRIRRIFPGADSVSRLVPVEVALTGPNVRLVKPGFLARATFSSDAKENAILVPASALLVSSGAEVVYLLREGRAKRTNVRTGMTYAGSIELVEGVSVGDTVIVAGNTALRDGMNVRVVMAALRDTDGDSPPPGRRDGGSPDGS